jgi:hypothetical protein
MRDLFVSVYNGRPGRFASREEPVNLKPIKGKSHEHVSQTD